MTSKKELNIEHRMMPEWPNFDVRCFLSSILILVAILTAISRAEAADSRVVDAVAIGDEPSERDHQFKGERTETRQINNHAVRVAGTNGGWFSWELKVLPDIPQELDIEFRGRPQRRPDTVAILIDGNRISTVRFGSDARQEYYPLTNIAKGKSAITVRFEIPEGSHVGGVASVAVMKIPPPTIASTSKASSPRTNYQFIVNAINDQHEPKSSGDRGKRHFDWWPAKGTNQWVQYDFAKPARVSAVEVYWFDDTGIGECRLPKSWRVLYRDHGEWKPVTHASGYGCEGDRYNRTTFDAVETDGLQLDVVLPDRFSSGLLQWKVEAAP